jgi:hypothetical protein
MGRVIPRVEYQASGQEDPCLGLLGFGCPEYSQQRGKKEKKYWLGEIHWAPGTWQESRGSVPFLGRLTRIIFKITYWLWSKLLIRG